MKQNFLPTLCDVVFLFDTFDRLTLVEQLSKPVYIRQTVDNHPFLETKAVSNLCQAVNARPFPFSFMSNLTFATRTFRDPVSLLVFHGAGSNGCNMEEVEGH